MNKVIKIAFFILLLLWCLSIFAEFFVPAINKIVFFLPHIKHSFSLLCHQEQAKVITYGSFQTFVCARCAGIYLGALLTSFIIIFPKSTPDLSRKFLFLASVPMLIDVTGTTFNLYAYSKIIAFLTGFLFGMVTFLYFYNAFIVLITEIRDKK